MGSHRDRASRPTSNLADSRLSHPSPIIHSKQNLIFRFLQTKARIQIWLYENTDTVIEGRIIVSTHASSTHTRARPVSTGPARA